MKRIALALVALLFAGFAQAALTTQQLATLKADILADGVLAPQCVPTGDGPFNIATAYNLAKSPAFTVWRTSVKTSEVGIAMNSTDLAGLTTANTNRLQVLSMFSGGTFNPSVADVRAGFDSIYSGAGGATTRANLAVLWRRLATRVEAVFATGTGSDAVPANLVFEGTLSVADVINACR